MHISHCRSSSYVIVEGRKPGNINARIRSELYFDVSLNAVSVPYINLKHFCSG
jgi:hypothetical protein